MILRDLLLLILMRIGFCEYCGNNKIPYGIEVHRDGRVLLLCSKPDCFDKKYAECDERPLRTDGCPSNSTWVGGLQRTSDLKVLYTQCCEYEYLADYSEIQYKKVVVRRGEFFEGEEKQESNGDVSAFDLITNIHLGHDEKGEFYAIQVHRYFCGKAPDPDPAWSPKDPWPHFNLKHKKH
ncbi:unnamed protein product, partial [Mesorhabditis belari]|uniref:Uncharacterized protein n=1 Tax=Mesorhabditis belari TaxID=2138241 RepID=A0AAF3FBM4_9BILA